MPKSGTPDWLVQISRQTCLLRPTGHKVGVCFSTPKKSEHLSISSNGCPDSNEITMPGNHKVTNIIGVTVHNTLKWTEHIKNIYTICARKIGIIRRLKKKLHPSIFKKIYVGVIRMNLEYGCVIWSGGPISKMLNLQRTFCQRHHISLPPLQKQFDYFTLMLFFTIRKREPPKYLHNLLPDPMSRSGYVFRKSFYPVQ